MNEREARIVAKMVDEKLQEFEKRMEQAHGEHIATLFKQMNALAMLSKHTSARLKVHDLDLKQIKLHEKALVKGLGIYLKRHAPAAANRSIDP